MKKLIAFCGAKESGKSTSAEIFKHELKNIRIVKDVAFAGHLKNVCSEVFNIPFNHFIDTRLKESELESYVNLTRPKIEEVFSKFNILEFEYDQHIRRHIGQVFDTPRKILQYIGTELLHPMDSLIHVKYALSQIDPEVITVITDLRFPQEFDELKTKPEFLPVYVNNFKAELSAAADKHQSEQGWKSFKDRCIILDNNGTLSELNNNIRELIRSYL